MNTVSYSKTTRIILTILALVVLASLAMTPAHAKTVSTGPITPSLCTKNCLQVTDISLSRVSPGIDQKYVTAIVTVKQISAGSNGLAVGVKIYALWTYPDGSQSKVIGTTDRTGRVSFNVADRPGVFTFTISDVYKEKFTFDKVNSIITKSIK